MTSTKTIGIKELGSPINESWSFGLELQRAFRDTSLRRSVVPWRTADLHEAGAQSVLSKLRYAFALRRTVHKQRQLCSTARWGKERSLEMQLKTKGIIGDGKNVDLPRSDIIVHSCIEKTEAAAILKASLHLKFVKHFFNTPSSHLFQYLCNCFTTTQF